MSWRERINVASLVGDLQPRVRIGDVIEVESDDPQERFYHAWCRAWLRETGHTFEQSIGYDPVELDPKAGGQLYWWIATGNDRGVFITSEGTATVGDFIAFTKDGGELRLAWGVGGDLPLIFAGLAEIVNVGLTAVGLVALARDGQKALDSRIYARQRRLFEDWRDGVGLSMEFRQAVFAEHDWDMEAFCRTFGCSRDAASRLLQELGYEPRRNESTARTWFDTSG